MLNLLRQRRNTRDVAAARLQKLELEEFTPLQIGQELVSQAPVRARGELWRLIRKAHPPAPQLSWLADAVRSLAVAGSRYMIAYNFGGISV